MARRRPVLQQTDEQVYQLPDEKRRPGQEHKSRPQAEGILAWPGIRRPVIFHLFVENAPRQEAEHSGQRGENCPEARSAKHMETVRGEDRLRSIYYRGKSNPHGVNRKNIFSPIAGPHNRKIQEGNEPSHRDLCRQKRRPSVNISLARDPSSEREKEFQYVVHHFLLSELGTVAHWICRGAPVRGRFLIIRLFPVSYGSIKLTDTPKNAKICP